MRGATLLICGTMVAACAGGSKPVRTPVARPAPAPTTVADAQFQDLFDQTCVTCHASPQPPMPDLSVEMSPDLLALSLNRLTAREMPPRGFKGLELFTDADRERLVNGLCRKTGRTDDVCREMAAEAVRPDVMRPGPVLANIFDENGPSPLPGGVRDRLLNPDGAGGVTGAPFSLRRPGTVTIVLMAALAACRPEGSLPAPARPGAPPPPSPSKRTPPKTQEERVRCVEQLLQAGLEGPAPAQ